MAGLSFGKKRKRRQINYELLQEILGWIFQIALVCFLAFLLQWYFGMKVGVIGDSMQPQLASEDMTRINRLVYDTRKPRRGEVIAFWPNGNDNAHCSIKRIVGLPGETVSCKDGKLLINGEVLKEKYKTTKIENPGLLEEEIVLGANEYFVLGDDRQSSEDSRSANVGNVKREEIAGKVWIVISPWNHIKLVR
ncbi:MAG: signal peptidase I [Faecalimonas sp.]|nr:signal peptidase I [Faecalimonas sp.]